MTSLQNSELLESEQASVSSIPDCPGDETAGCFRTNREDSKTPERMKRDALHTSLAVETRSADFQPAKPRIAVIGLGYWGPNLLRNFNAIIGDNLRACCDCDPARMATIARTYPNVETTNDPEAIFADDTIDAVAIATPVGIHYRLAKAALNAGKSVLVEKPFTSSVEHAEELVELAKQRGKVLMVDHTFLFSPPVRKMKEIVETGRLGQLRFIDSVRINLGLFQHDVNVVWDLTPHDLSIVDHLVGRMPRSLSAFGAAHTGNGIECIAYLNLDFGEGLIANFHVNWLSPVKIRHTMLGGSEKSLIYNDLDPVEKIKIYDSGITIRENDPEGRRRQLIEYRTGDVWAPHVASEEPLRNMAAHFVDCVQYDKRSEERRVGKECRSRWSPYH